MALRTISKLDGTRWALSKPSARQRLAAYFGHLLHIKFELRLPSAKGLFWSAVRLTIYVGLASAPFWIDFFDRTEVSRSRLILYSGIMLTLLLLNDGYAAFVKNAARRERLENHREAAALTHRNLINELEKMIGPPTFNLQDAAFRSVINRTLDAILDRVKEELDTLDAPYLEVTLLLFEPKQKILVAERAVGVRATGTRLDRGKTMAYHVARSGQDWRQVPDLTKETVFQSHGLSERACPYRSILLMPIVEQSGDSSSGVVTVDSSRPYEFWNKTVTDRLYKQLMPFIRLLAILCQGSPGKVSCR